MTVLWVLLEVLDDFLLVDGCLPIVSFCYAPCLFEGIRPLSDHVGAGGCFFLPVIYRLELPLNFDRTLELLEPNHALDFYFHRVKIEQRQQL